MVATTCALLLALVACGGGTKVPAKGSLAGRVVVGGASSGSPLRVRTSEPAAADRSAAAGHATSWSLDDSSLEFVAGELIVGFRSTGGLDAMAVLGAASSLEAAGVSFALARAIPGITAGLYRAPGLSHQQTLALARELSARPEVAYAQPNYIHQALAVPNDPLYGRQWHYDAIDMEGAWDITTGSAAVVVAVLDTGILWSSADASKRHPDFAGRLVPGYDFITNPSIAADGDGRDSDPFDAVEFANYHGSHVAGTIGAASNNGVGVAGVDWQAKLLPVRVLGAGGGSLDDIIDALMWAAGYAVAGVPVNANPADVVNLSLGGSGACSPAWQAALDFVADDVIVVAAAGNATAGVSGFAPAGCAGVITVGATDAVNERSYYSNYGSRIDVMAPGGDMNMDLNGDLFVDGVFSTGYNDISDTFTYVYQQGTSMAAPHVTGVVALMKALEPNLTTSQALAALRASATPLSDEACDGWGATRDLTSSDCGAGLIDASKALGYIDTGDVPDPVGATLRFTPSALEFGANSVRIDFQVRNISGAPVHWTLEAFYDFVDNPGTIDDVGGAFDVPDDRPDNGFLPVDGTVTTAVVIDRTKLSADGNYQVLLIFDLRNDPTDDDPFDEELLLMRFSKTTTTAPTLGGPMIVAAYIEDEFGELVTSGFQSSSNAIVNFDFEVLPGWNLLAAWSDKNDNGLIDDGDLFGYYPTALDIAPGQRRTGLTLVVDPIFSNPPDPSALIEELERTALRTSDTRP